jgi:hypothetical protein
VAAGASQPLRSFVPVEKTFHPILAETDTTFSVSS